MVASVSKLSLFVILLLSGAIALATESPAPALALALAPTSGVFGGEECRDTLVSASPCLPYISPSPNNESFYSMSTCCDSFSSILYAGNAFCLCYFLKEPLLFGFPIDSSRLLSLFSFCSLPNITSPTNATSMELDCAVLQALSPIGSAGYEPLYPPASGPEASPPSVINAPDSSRSPTMITAEASDSPPYPPPESDSEYPPEFDTAYPQISSAAELRITLSGGFRICWATINKLWQDNSPSHDPDMKKAD